MTYEKIKQLIDRLNRIMMQPMEFEGLRGEISYVSRARHSRHWVVQPHYHPWFEFNYVAKGSVYTKIEDQEFLVEAGQSYLVAPGVVHAHRHNNTGDDGICIRFSLEADPQKDQAVQLYTELSRCRAYPFDSAVEQMPVSDGIYGTKAAFMTWLMRLYDNWSGSPDETETKAVNSVSSQVELYLKEYYQTKIQVEDIANALNISYRSLARQFKAESGVTISDKLTELRLNAAKQLLTDSNMPLYDVAAAVGYENEFYFSNIFKKNEGISPSRYRSERK